MPMTIPTDDDLNQLAERVGAALQDAHRMLAVAESCTGGYVCKVLTDIVGSSHWFDRGFITYAVQSKQDLLGVPADILMQHGAVSEPTVRAMATGVLANSQAHISVAISGIAGPGGGSLEKPVGLVCFAWMTRGGECRAEAMQFGGNRDAVRRQAVAHALNGVLGCLG